jgi:hypothetical protein
MMAVEARALMFQVVEIGGVAFGDEIGPHPVPYHQDDDVPARPLRRLGGAHHRSRQNNGTQGTNDADQAGQSSEHSKCANLHVIFRSPALFYHCQME